MESDRLKVLMFAEAVTLAHVARPLALAAALHQDGAEIVLACDTRYQRFVADGPWVHVPLTSIPSERFLSALAHGKPVYDMATLQAYVDEDRAHIRRHRPDVVVGDFRLSLGVSARLERVPYVAISNAYWSPAYGGRLPMPVLPMTRWLPLRLAAGLFQVGAPLALGLHCRPINRLRKQYGLPAVKGSLRSVYTDADHVLLADVEALFPMERPMPEQQTYVGPLVWSPPGAIPAWWDELDPKLPCVYVTLGSSGPSRSLETVLLGLGRLPIQVVASTAGTPAPAGLPGNVRVADYLAGDVAAARSELVVCNGGSLSAQQALISGVPVLGIASNMDQFMNMEALAAAGVGLVLRSDRLTQENVAAAVSRLLQEPGFRGAARRLRPEMQSQRPVGETFRAIVRRLRQK